MKSHPNGDRTILPGANEGKNKIAGISLRASKQGKAPMSKKLDIQESLEPIGSMSTRVDIRPIPPPPALPAEAAPVSVAIDGADFSSIHIHVSGAAALALRLGAAMDKQSLWEYLTKALAFQAASAIADTNIGETPAYAELFGLEKEAQ